MFIGDIVGKSGREALFEHLPFLKSAYDYDLLIINGENSAHGKGITKKIYNSFVQAGADCITLGNHAFSKDNIYTFIEDADRLIRPANMNPTDVGRSVRLIDFKGLSVGIFNLHGSIFMENHTDVPHKTMTELIQKYPCDIRIVDLHAEATSEKYSFMEMFKDSCQMIVGTHTHIQTADEAVHDGCAFICDVGMTGPYHSVLGRDIEEVIEHFTVNPESRYKVSTEKAMLCAVFVIIDDEKKKAEYIERIQLRPE